MKNITKFAVSFVAVAALFVAANAQAYTHMGTLKMGSTGSQVMELQKALNAAGYTVSTSGLGSAGNESTYFGAKTKDAVMKFQAAKGLVADGIVGPASGAALSGLTGTGSGGTSTVPGCTAGAMFSSTTGAPCTGGTSTPTGPLAGTDGTLDSFDQITSYSGEEVGEGQSDVKVAGFEIQASNDGDIAIKSIKVTLDSAGNTGSKHLDDYIDGVSIWMGSTKVGSADADDFSEDSDVYSKVVTLSNSTVKADEEEKFYISVDAVNTFDSSDIATTNDSWTVAVENIRYIDGSGVVTTVDSADIVLNGNLDYDSAGDGVAMDFVSFGDAADTEIKVSKDSDSPDAGIIMVDEEDEKTVSLLTGKLKLSGDSDVTIDTFYTTLTVGGGDDLDEIVSEITFILDGEEFTADSVATASGTTTATITFSDMDFDMSAGDTAEYEITADVFGTDDHGEGDTLTASITSDNMSAMDVENEEGDQVADSDKIGTAVGEAQDLRSNGISLDLIDTNATSNADGTLGTYQIEFKITAVGDDIYVGTVANSSKYGIAVKDASGSATTVGVSHAISNDGGSGNSTSTTSGGNWKINEGTSITLTIDSFVAGSSVAAGAYRSVLSSLYWTTDDTDAVTTTDNSYSSNMEDYHSDYTQLL